MKDVSQKVSVSESAQIANVKGHTKIILTNVRDGKQKIIEHDNVFQSSILEKQLRSLGAANNNPWANSTWKNNPLWRNLCGGIFLFRDTITAPSEYMPAGNVMVANGAYGVSNSGTPVELGSYNSIESATNGANSLTFVYDWGTSQGNGTISCVALTSEIGGFIGYGNNSGVASNTKKNFIYNQNSTDIVAQAFDANKKYKIKSVSMANKQVVISETENLLAKASIFSGQNWVDKTKTWTGDVTGEQWTELVRQCANGKIIIIESNYNLSVNNGSTAYFLVYDPANDTLTKKTIVNTSGKSLKLVVSRVNILLDDSDNIYIPCNDDHKIYKFDSTGVFVDAIDDSVFYEDYTNGYLTDELFYSNTPNGMFIFDGTKSRICNGIPHTNGNEIFFDYIESIDAFQYRYSQQSQQNRTIYKNPLFLSTINNLDSAITKDNTQTMKVIYTLTEA